MEFHQKSDAETGAQSQAVASSDKLTTNFSASTLRKHVRSGIPQPALRSVLATLDAMLTRCYHQGDYRIFAPFLLGEDATATRATLELIRRQSKILDAALNRAEAQLLEAGDSEARAAAALPEGAAG